jgi:RNA polymerase sigma factor FliA
LQAATFAARIFGLKPLGVAALGVLLSETGMFEDPNNATEKESSRPDVRYFQKAQRAEQQNILKSCLAKLGPDQRLVIQQHYLQDVSFHDIGVSLGVTKGRVSQLHQQALKQLHHQLKGHSGIDFSW